MIQEFAPVSLLANVTNVLAQEGVDRSASVTPSLAEGNVFGQHIVSNLDAVEESECFSSELIALPESLAADQFLQGRFSNQAKAHPDSVDVGAVVFDAKFPVVCDGEFRLRISLGVNTPDDSAFGHHHLEHALVPEFHVVIDEQDVRIVRGEQDGAERVAHRRDVAVVHHLEGDGNAQFGQRFQKTKNAADALMLDRSAVCGNGDKDSGRKHKAKSTKAALS